MRGDHVTRAGAGGSVLWVDSIVATRKHGGCGDSLDSLIHEGAHAFAPDAAHSDSGVFAKSHQGATRIDLVSLVAVCAVSMGTGRAVIR